ncbi:MAG: hypothetical protein R3C52_09155 [Hyphomonadaceae bacterium]
MTKHFEYSSGHPWYYVLGGAVLFPRQIVNDVHNRGYRGYAASDIVAADALSEPKRSRMLRDYREKFRDDLKRDLSRYRQCANALRSWREHHALNHNDPECADVHTNISLKHNHLYNDFAHLIWLEELLSRQRDLFDL